MSNSKKFDPTHDHLNDLINEESNPTTYIPSKLCRQQSNPSSNHGTSIYRPTKNQPSHPLSPNDVERKNISDENYDFIKKNRNYLDCINSSLINENKRFNIKGSNKNKHGLIFVNDHSSIWSAIDCHRRQIKKIFVLNFADGVNPGGGYKNGRNAQEESLCRQTLLYPSLEKVPEFYQINKKKGPRGSHSMIYSENVLVIRDDNWDFIDDKFNVNIISSAAVDNRSNVSDADKIMRERIIKIVMFAASQSGPETCALILGAFGCGVFKNDPNKIAEYFKEVLVDRGYRNYFDSIIFPIYKSHEMKEIFQRHFWNA